MDQKTKGQIEAALSEAIIKFEREYMGRGPTETKTYVIRDMIFIRLRGVLTPAEEHLAKSSEGAKMIKATRAQLLENARGLLEGLVSDITGSEVRSLHTDISTKTGERIIVFTLANDLEGRLTRKSD